MPVGYGSVSGRRDLQPAHPELRLLAAPNLHHGWLSPTPGAIPT